MVAWGYTETEAKLKILLSGWRGNVFKKKKRRITRVLLAFMSF